MKLNPILIVVAFLILGATLYFHHHPVTYQPRNARQLLKVPTLRGSSYFDASNVRSIEPFVPYGVDETECPCATVYIYSGERIYGITLSTDSLYQLLTKLQKEAKG